ncbi:RsmB/NOP family class I SAM-dependent RNA methyltransferase [uncultured Desulfovibrio sp.]|uniref:RsmB/NOP family class I SAM-dependent RNA methyltransferase n=1 Tax=uncultured Desulfovibrio sp. TaxID=167968 RepID=UPI00261E1DD8|nr:RsmB/NOP family class I SAM-dependent RNA methyltransferase [uncultured Desulfovibrio sp.]
MKTSETPAPTTAGRSFRLLCSPEETPRVEALLQAQGYRFEPEPFSPFCRRLLDEPRPLGASLAAFFGYIYIQDRSSMLPPLALAPEEGSSVLDVCASPGSKTGFLAQLVGKNGFVLGNEPSRARLATLRANMHACNLLSVSTCTYEGQALPLRPGSWEAIQLDPPCSGWGTVEKHPRVMELWQGEKVQPLVGLQRLLLRQASALLAPGGKLVYSTCTTNVAENEEQVRFAEEELGLERLALTPFPGFVWEELPGGEGTLRVDGQRSAAQGFYVALFRKPYGFVESVPAPLSEPSDARSSRRGGKNPAKREQPGQELPREALAGPCCDPALLPPGRVMLYGDQVRFLPEDAARLLPPDMIWQGALLGKFAGGRLHPAPRLRALLPRRPDAGTALVLDSPDDLTALLSGQSRRTELEGREAALWWQDLPLGRVSLKQGRVVATFS